MLAAFFCFCGGGYSANTPPGSLWATLLGRPYTRCFPNLLNVFDGI